MNMVTRYPIIDFIRFVAIFLMVLFHFAYNLNIFGFIKIDFFKDTFWFYLPRLIVFLFLFAVGISLCISHAKKIQWKKFNTRLSKILLCALLVTGFTFVAFPKFWVYFGTLHCIALTSIIGVFFTGHPKISLILAIIIISFQFSGFNFPWIELSHKSMDYIPPLPWISCVFLGIFSYHQGLHKVPFISHPIISFFSKHSLITYMLHQPILFSLVWIYYKFQLQN